MQHSSFLLANPTLNPPSNHTSLRRKLRKSNLQNNSLIQHSSLSKITIHSLAHLDSNNKKLQKLHKTPLQLRSLSQKPSSTSVAVLNSTSTFLRCFYSSSRKVRSALLLFIAEVYYNSSRNLLQISKISLTTLDDNETSFARIASFVKTLFRNQLNLEGLSISGFFHDSQPCFHAFNTVLRKLPKLQYFESKHLPSLEQEKFKFGKISIPKLKLKTFQLKDACSIIQRTENPDLELLSVSVRTVDKKESDPFISQIMTKFKCLKELEFETNRFISLGSLSLILQSNFMTLTKLSVTAAISKNDIDVLKMVFEKLQANTQLKELKLGFYSSDVLEKLENVPHIEWNKFLNLTKLEIENRLSLYNKEMVRILFSGLGELGKAQKLQSFRYQSAGYRYVMESSSLMKIMEEIGKLTSLEEMSIDLDARTENLNEVLVKALKPMEGLMSLKVSSLELWGEEQFSMWMECLEKCERLEELQFTSVDWNIYRPNISNYHGDGEHNNAGVVRFIRGLPKLKMLKKVILELQSEADVNKIFREMVGISKLVRLEAFELFVKESTIPLRDEGLVDMAVFLREMKGMLKKFSASVSVDAKVSLEGLMKFESICRGLNSLDFVRIHVKEWNEVQEEVQEVFGRMGDIVMRKNSGEMDLQKRFIWQ